MQELRFIPVRLTFVLVLGIIFGWLTSPHPVYPLLAAALCLLLLALKLLQFLQVPAMMPGLLIGITTFLLGMLSYTIALPENQRRHYLQYNIEGIHLYYLKVREVWKPTSYARRYVAILSQADSQSVEGKVLLNIRGTDGEALKIDDHLLIRGELSEIRKNPNPFQFDYRQYLSHLGIARQLTADNSQIITPLPSNASMYGRAAQIREEVVESLAQAGMGKEALAMVKALLLGQRMDISPETFTAFRDAGAMHILAVSGLHIGILLMLLNLLTKPLEWIGGGRVARLCLLLALLWGYALLAGFTPSIVRAVSMFSFVAYALYLNRPANSFNIMALSVVFILLAIDPLLLFQAGFQMSYAAVCAILCFLPLLQGKRVIRYRFARKAWQLLAVSVAAQIGVLPVSLYYFHQFPGLFFLANLLIIPFLGVLLGMGFIVASMAYAGILPNILAGTFEMLLRLMTGVVEWISEQEAFILRDIPFSLTQLLLLYLIVILLARLLSRYSVCRLAWVLVATILLQCQACWQNFRVSHEERIWITHRPGHSLLLHQAGDSLISASTPGKFDDNNLIRGFKLGARCRSVHKIPLQAAYRWGSSSLLVIDGKTPWSIPAKGNRFLLLTGSAKIHLGRLLDSLKPSMVIADGSNFNTYANRWKQSCQARKIPFHYTGTDGAYSLQITGY